MAMVPGIVVQAQPAAPEVPVVDEPAPNSAPGAGESCINEALARKLPEWSCVGEFLTTPQGTETVEVIPDARVPEDVLPEEPAVERRDLPDPDDYDTWCETSASGSCARWVSNDVTESKHSMAYGDDDGVIGTWEIIIRTNMNGRSARWTVTYIWDTGPPITIQRSDIHCFEVVPGPFQDSRCGIHYAGAPATIGGGPKRFQYGPIQGGRLADAGTYYGSLFGQNTPSGYPYVLSFPTMETGRFVCPTQNGNCYVPED